MCMSLFLFLNKLFAPFLYHMISVFSWLTFLCMIIYRLCFKCLLNHKHIFILPFDTRGRCAVCCYSIGVWLFATLWTVARHGLLYLWDYPGKNIRVSCHFLLQEVFPTRDQTHVSYVSCIHRHVLYHMCPKLLYTLAPPYLGGAVPQSYLTGWFPGHVLSKVLDKT